MIKRIIEAFKHFGAPDEFAAIDTQSREAVDRLLRDRYVRLERLRQEVDVLGRREPGS